MVTTAMVGCSLCSLVVTPTGGGRPGARSSAAGGPDEIETREGRRRHVGRHRRESASGGGRARSTARGGRRHPAYAKPRDGPARTAGDRYPYPLSFFVRCRRG